MSKLVVQVTAVVVGLMVASAATQTAHADVLLASVSRPSPVAAFSGAVAWSSYSPARRSYSLMVLRDGRITRAPVQSRRAPFDVSLGPTASGKVAAVYSRCDIDPGRRVPGLLTYLRGLVANPQTGRGCNIREYVLGEKRERVPKVRGLSALSTAWPSTWRGRLVFAGLRRAKGRWQTALYDAATRGSSRARRLVAGPSPRTAVAPRVTGTALRANRVVFGWDWPAPGSGDASGVFSTALGSHRVRTVTKATSATTQLFAPGLHGADVWAGVFSSVQGQGGISFFRPGEQPSFVATSPYVASTAVDGPRIVYSVSTAAEPGRDCQALGLAGGAPTTCGIYLSDKPAP